MLRAQEGGGGEVWVGEGGGGGVLVYSHYTGKSDVFLWVENLRPRYFFWVKRSVPFFVVSLQAKY